MTTRQRVTVPKPPADLKPDAQARWQTVAPILAARGAVDLDALRTYCQVWARWREADDGITKAGQLTRTPTGRVMPSPLIAVEEKAALRVRELEERLGISTKTEPDGQKPLSLRAFATRHGVRDNAIRKAIAAGRLVKSVGRHANGHPFIADVELGDAEWNVNRAQAPKAQIIGADTLAAAQRSATLERSRKLKIENDRTEGRLIDVDKASKLAFEASRTIRKAVQNIPSRIAAELAAESDAARVYSKLETALREALNVAATDLMAVGE